MIDNKNSPSLMGQNKIVKAQSPSEYRKPSSERRFELSYGDDRFYLTSEERNAFLTAIGGGADIVQIGEMTLSRFFKFIIPLENPKLPISEEDQKLINFAEKNKEAY